MSLEFYMEADEDELVEFLASEYVKGTGIPVHVFSVVNAHMTSYNRSLGLTDGAGVLFMEGDGVLKSYGCGPRPFGIVDTLNRCNAGVSCADE